VSSAMFESMRVNPQFQELVKKRGRFAWTLAATVLICFYGFVLMVAYQPAALGRPLTEGGMLTVGVAIELFLFIFFWLLSFIYVRRANGEFDRLTQEIIKQALKDNK
jgi:uncharacterized membrane protein (DUF485 family)